jgi:hypothetical protein
MDWYSNTALPVYVSKEPKQKAKIMQTTSKSPFCHLSVGKWKASGSAFVSPERKDRCARVSASVAHHLVQKLNAWKDGKCDAKSVWTPVKDVGITAQQNCTECHGSNMPSAPTANK